MVHAVEKELLKKTGFKGDKTVDRQDYLAAMTKAVDKDLDEDDFDALSDDAVKWFTAAVEAMNKRTDIPEFDAVEDEPEEGTDDDEDEAEEVDEEAEDDDEGDDDEDAGDDDEEAPEAAAEASAEDDDEVDEETGEVTKAPAKKAKAPPKKAAKPAPKPAKKAAKEPKPEPKKHDPSRYKHLTGEKDRYGILKGTKLHDGLMMLEKGATMQEVKAECGDTYYNAVRKLVEAGHRVEKEGARITLIHKDDVGKSRRKGK